MQKPFAITLDVGSSLVNHTGSWRNTRPVYVNRLPPCNHQCPAGENIQAWLFHAESGDYEQAWRKLVEDNPFTDGEESITSSDHTAAGFGVYAVTHSNQKETIQFSAKETTLVTLGILYDASGLTETSGNISGTLKQRDPAKKYKVAFHRENTTDCERRISKNYAFIDTLSKTFGNNESVYTVTLVVVPNSSNELYTYYLGAKA